MWRDVTRVRVRWADELFVQGLGLEPTPSDGDPLEYALWTATASFGGDDEASTMARRRVVASMLAQLERCVCVCVRVCACVLVPFAARVFGCECGVGCGVGRRHAVCCIADWTGRVPSVCMWCVDTTLCDPPAGSPSFAARAFEPMMFTPFLALLSRTTTHSLTPPTVLETAKTPL